jgi:16S rRNA (guanine(1405)-N(7))-methyltransferase
MGLPAATRYYAYDLHGPRVELINHYFRLQGLAPLASQADILTDPPQNVVDVALFFKEAHRFEQRQRGCNRAFWQAIPARWLLVSLPTRSLSGKHDKLDQHRRLVYSAIEGLDWPVTEVDFGDEIVFCIRKNAIE